MEFFGSFVMLTVSLFILIILSGLLSSKNRVKSQLSKVFGSCLICMVIWIVSLMLQIIFQNAPVNPVLFEGFASFGACFIPVAFMFLSIIFAKTKINFKKTYLLLLFVPILSTILMFTNNFHNLFYEKYSIYLNQCISGPYMIIHSAYSYILIATGFIYLLRYSFKNSGFFSKQSVLIFLGSIIPVAINVLRNF